tara:strand:+ start:7710 stop:8846 length:1137 start_codon:yes stop_codon:yes gene_type:complete
MAGEVRSVKPNAKTTAVYKDINARIRRLIDSWQWSSLISSTVLNIPNATSTGSIDLTSGSKVVVGTSTAWPVSDVSNTTMIGGNRTTGYVEITPADMTGITIDRPVYISDGVFSEAVPVVETSSTSFVGIFQYQHNDGTPITCSSLAGLQLKLGTFWPVYTVQAISSATGAILDMNYGGPSLTGSAYSILMAYVTIDPMFRDFIQVWDPRQGQPIATHVSQTYLSRVDPQRMSSGYPQALVDRQPTSAGSAQFELWPYQQTAYNMPVLYVKQWPELKKPTDRPPTFLNPSVIIDGAIADSLRRRDLRADTDKDPYFDPQLAQIYEQKYAEGAKLAMNADEGRRLQTLSMASPYGGAGGGMGPNASWAQSHAVGVWDGY